MPRLRSLRLYPVEMLKVVGISIANAVGFYLMFSYIVTWLQLYAHVKPSVSLMITSINMALMLLITPLSGMLSDQLGRKTVLVATALGFVILSLPLWAMMRTGGVVEIFLAQLVFAVLAGAYGAVNPVAICEMFPASVRSSAASTAYNLTMGLVGGTAPIVATWLIDKSDRPLAAALYLMLAGAVSAAAVLTVRSFTPRGESEFAVATTGPAVERDG
jgi:MHS family proline/betaine transporter-like MFS transporter